jgi:hypothetical protein
MAETKEQAPGSLSRVFVHRPDRVTAAWRRVRFAEARTSRLPDNLLDDVVESFVHELGAMLTGAPGSPWSRTRGVLRLSPERGTQGLHEEFAALRRCLADACDVLGGTPEERARIDIAVDEAVKSAVNHYKHVADPSLPAPEIPFGGLMVEYFERPSTHKAEGEQEPTAPVAFQ